MASAEAGPGYAASKALARDTNEPAASEDAETTAPERNKSRRVNGDMGTTSWEQLGFIRPRKDPSEKHQYMSAEVVETIARLLRSIFQLLSASRQTIISLLRFQRETGQPVEELWRLLHKFKATARRRAARGRRSFR